MRRRDPIVGRRLVQGGGEGGAATGWAGGRHAQEEEEEEPGGIQDRRLHHAGDGQGLRGRIFPLILPHVGPHLPVLCQVRAISHITKYYNLME